MSTKGKYLRDFLHLLATDRHLQQLHAGCVLQSPSSIKSTLQEALCWVAMDIHGLTLHKGGEINVQLPRSLHAECNADAAACVFISRIKTFRLTQST